MVKCEICGFEAKNAAGLAGHRKMKHGVSPSGVPGIKKTKVLLIKIQRRLYNRIVNEADQIGMLPKEFICSVLRQWIGLETENKTRERKLEHGKYKTKVTESELVILRGFVGSNLPFADIKTQMHTSDYRLGVGLLILLRKDLSQENEENRQVAVLDHGQKEGKVL